MSFFFFFLGRGVGGGGGGGLGLSFTVFGKLLGFSSLQPNNERGEIFKDYNCLIRLTRNINRI